MNSFSTSDCLVHMSLGQAILQGMTDEEGRKLSGKNALLKLRKQTRSTLHLAVAIPEVAGLGPDGVPCRSPVARFTLGNLGSAKYHPRSFAMVHATLPWRVGGRIAGHFWQFKKNEVLQRICILIFVHAAAPVQIMDDDLEVESRDSQEAKDAELFV